MSARRAEYYEKYRLNEKKLQKYFVGNGNLRKLGFQQLSAPKNAHTQTGSPTNIRYQTPVQFCVVCVV